ncbi:MAG: exosortase/archaeosortase family protein [Candidatus Micrarchaeota archaeon]|nr:exosortase/archaeosortase family protein [Candidatus Micrarchaeota archaeon]
MMGYSKNHAIILLAILVAVLVSTSLFITPLTISDSDPSTYIIVPIIMLPLFALLMHKNRLEIRITRTDIAAGAAVFMLFAAVTVYLRMVLQYLFLSYRIDMLLFPLAIMSVVILLFGIRNANRFKALIIYPLLASPLVLMPVLRLNSEFAITSTVAIASVARLFFHGLSYIAPITISANGYSIGIGESCIGIGILISTILFMLPLAYYYDGKLHRKMLWVLSGFALMLAFNMVRMLAITLAWFYYGPNNATIAVHIFAGVILFYIAIALMILLARRYGLSMPRHERSRRTSKLGMYKAGAIVAAILCLFYLFLTVNYSSAHPQPSQSLSSMQLNITNSSAMDFLGPLIRISNATEVFLVNANDTAASVGISNASIPSTNPIVVILLHSRLNITVGSNGTNTTTRSYNFMSANGTIDSLYYILYNGTDYFIYHSTKPFMEPDGSYVTANMYAIVPANITDLTYNRGCSYYRIYSAMISPQALLYPRSLTAKLSDGYCAIKSLVD